VAASQGCREVRYQMGEIRCPRCKKTLVTELNETRFRAGSFYDEVREQSFDQLCEECHREVVK
jgi:transposase-like protein